MAAYCGVQCVGQDHVAGGKKAVCTFLNDDLLNISKTLDCNRQGKRVKYTGIVFIGGNAPCYQPKPYFQYLSLQLEGPPQCMRRPIFMARHGVICRASGAFSHLPLYQWQRSSLRTVNFRFCWRGRRWGLRQQGLWRSNRRRKVSARRLGYIFLPAMPVLVL